MFLLVLGQLIHRLSVGLIGVEQLILLLDMVTVEVEVLSLSPLVQLFHDLGELLVVALRRF